jgi:solute carrier family 25 (mitochondrial oxoglutarate transporter), member 11
MCATSITQPIDMIKVRIQLRGESLGKTSPFDVAKEIYHQGGIKGFYKGIDSALLRQAVYASLRIGFYYTLNERTHNKETGEVHPAMRAINSLIAGAVGAAIANPFDLALVRMQADQTLPEAERRNYRNVFHAFQTILKDESFMDLYRGCSPTVARAMSINLSMLFTYDIFKKMLENRFGKKRQTMVGATFISGTFVSVCSLPFDNMKTKLQKQTKNKEGKYMYENLRDCTRKTVAREGVTGLWTGLPTFYMRVAPHAMFTLLFAEFFKGIFGITTK